MAPQMASCVRVVKTAFGDGLVAARDIAAGETVLTEQPAFLLLDDAPVTRPRLLAAVSGALGLAPGAEKSVLLYGGLELWLRCDAARRAVLLKIFSTPDDSEMAAFVLGVVEAVRQQEEEKEQGEEDGAEVEPASARQQLAASEAQQHASKALCCWLLSSHATCCESKGETGCALYPTGSYANHSCDPNMTYQSAGQHGLVYRALRPIPKGEELCFSYLLAHELLMPHTLRRKLLQARKCFACACSRCTADAASGGETDARALPCACGGSLTLTSDPNHVAMLEGGRLTLSSDTWLCSRGGEGCKGPPGGPEGGRLKTSLLAQEKALVREAMAGTLELRGGTLGLRGDGAGGAGGAGGTEGAAGGDGGAVTGAALYSRFYSPSLRPQELEAQGWEGHWAAAAALWGNGIARLRGGVERGDTGLVRQGCALLQEYFAWVQRRDKHATRRHFVSSQVAECYACLAALPNDREAAAFAARLSAPYLAALDYEYGVEDEHNIAMHRFVATHCAACGGAATNHCSRCKLVHYCGQACQRQAWKGHKLECVPA